MGGWRQTAPRLGGTSAGRIRCVRGGTAAIGIGTGKGGTDARKSAQIGFTAQHWAYERSESGAGVGMALSEPAPFQKAHEEIGTDAQTVHPP